MDADVQNIQSLLGQGETQPIQVDDDVKNITTLLGNKPKTGWEGFTDTAKKIAKETDFPASVMLGQASLETGRGTSNFAKNRNNYFGYKAYDSNPDAASSYNAPDQSIRDYVNLIENNPRYSWAYKQYLQDRDPYKLINAIRQSGYATDPNYVQKVISTPEFQQNL